jgi:hypothetical protein
MIIKSNLLGRKITKEDPENWAVSRNDSHSSLQGVHATGLHTHCFWTGATIPQTPERRPDDAKLVLRLRIAIGYIK